jgi:ATP phosphoribosyltransferase regulatory subunit
MTTTTTREPHTLILFDSANYAKAVHKAIKSRNQGIRTTIQYKESVEDQQAFQSNFSDVVWLIEGDGNNE